MIYKATINLYLDVPSEGDACDAIAETMRPLLKRYEPDSYFLDWRYNPGQSYPDIATESEIRALES